MRRARTRWTPEASCQDEMEVGNASLPVRGEFDGHPLLGKEPLPCRVHIGKIYSLNEIQDRRIGAVERGEPNSQRWCGQPGKLCSDNGERFQTTGGCLRRSSPNCNAFQRQMRGPVSFFCDRCPILVWQQARPASLGGETEIITQDTRFASAASLDTLRKHVSVPNVRRVCLFAAASSAAFFNRPQVKRVLDHSSSRAHAFRDPLTNPRRHAYGQE